MKVIAPSLHGWTLGRGRMKIKTQLSDYQCLWMKEYYGKKKHLLDAFHKGKVVMCFWS